MTIVFHIHFDCSRLEKYLGKCLVILGTCCCCWYCFQLLLYWKTELFSECFDQLLALINPVCALPCSSSSDPLWAVLLLHPGWGLYCWCGNGCCGFNCFAGMLSYPPLHSDVSHWHTDVASPCWCQPQMGLNWKFHGLLPQWDLILLPHSGYCSLLPTAPVASILDSPTRAVGPAILSIHIYTHACCHRSRLSTLGKEWHHPLDDVGFALLPELVASAVLTARRPQRH